VGGLRRLGTLRRSIRLLPGQKFFPVFNGPANRTRKGQCHWETHELFRDLAERATHPRGFHPPDPLFFLVQGGAGALQPKPRATGIPRAEPFASGFGDGRAETRPKLVRLLPVHRYGSTTVTSRSNVPSPSASSRRRIRWWTGSTSNCRTPRPSRRV